MTTRGCLTEYAVAPLAIATRRPRFSWEVALEGRNRRQSAYQILVATAEPLLALGEADLWDSGKVDSSMSVGIEYSGTELRSNMDCYWVVRIWDEAGVVGAFSQSAYFGTALLDPLDWHAAWIGMGDPNEPFPDPASFQRQRVAPEVEAFEPDPRAPLLRKEFVLDGPVRRARAFVCGLGLFELHLNGEKVGDDVLTTARTDFRKRALYVTYDVTAHLGQGGNALGLILGNGWFNGQKRYWGWQMQWHGSPRAIVQVDVEYEDGSRQLVVSDASWQGSWSPITFNCIYDGEHYDARLEQPGWGSCGFDAEGWQDVHEVPPPGGRLVPTTHEEERVVETIRPVSLREPEPGVFVYDLGVNITGWVQLKIPEGTPGQQLVLKYGEAQHANGALNASSNNAAHQKDEYTLKGGGNAVFEPRFTFHGFQFVEITGYPGTPDLDAVLGCFVRTAVPQTGTFECGNDLINRIHRCTLQSQLCNVQMGVPTDDTQRPERLGWGADAWATAQEALYNLWMPRVYRKYIQDFCDQQYGNGLVGMITPQAGAEEDLVWSAAFVLIPWWQYVHCGDLRILEDAYPALERYISFLQRTGTKQVSTEAPDDVLASLLWHCDEEDRFPAEADRGHLQISQWGDHLATAEGSASRANLPLSMATAFYALDVQVMSRIADALGREDDAAAYRSLACDITDAFNERFFNAGLGYYDTGVQSAQAWPLAFGLVPEEHRDRVANYLIRSVGSLQRRLTTGYVSTKFAIQALSMCGRDDLVWERAVATEYPSWGYMLRNNRTTSCERWDGDGGSLNHAPLGAAIDEWFYWGLAGIRPDEAAPGFKGIVFKPYLPRDLPWAKASLQAARGEIISEWSHNGTTATFSATVPANCTGKVYLPVESPDSVTESGTRACDAAGVQLALSDDGMTVFEIGAGSYCFGFPIHWD